MLALLFTAALIALLAVGCRYLALKRQLRAMALDIGDIGRRHSNRQLTVATGDRDACALALAVNGLYEQLWQERADKAAGLSAMQRSMADISHDLRTPLTALRGDLGLLEKPDIEEAQRRQYLDTARRRADALGRLVDTLFLHARLETGEYPFDLQALDLNEAVAASLAAHYAAFESAGQPPDVQLCGGQLPITADGLCLERLFANLFTNSLRHGAGEITVRSGREAGKAFVTVANRAPTLTPKECEQLFQRSFVADGTRGGGSSGLGLTIVRQLAEGMGGEAGACLAGGRLSITLLWPLRAGGG